MTIQTNAFSTVTAIGNREDLTNVIYNIDPYDTPFMTMIGRGKASAVLHEWQSDTFASASSSNAQLEGDVVTGSSTTPTTRLTNYCQISSKDVVVTGTQEAVEHAGRDSEMAYQLAKRGKELKRDMESVITQNQAKAAGSTAVARKLRSLEAWITSNTQRETTATSGGTKGKSATSATSKATDATTQRAFTETLLKKLLATMYSNGADPTTIMVGPHNKQTFSTFTGRSSARQNVDAETVQAGADLYASDYGTLKVVPNRFMRDRTAVVFDPSYAAVAFLRPIFTYDLAKTGDSIRKDMRVEYTLEMRNEKAFGVVSDIKTSS